MGLNCTPSSSSVAVLQYSLPLSYCLSCVVCPPLESSSNTGIEHRWIWELLHSHHSWWLKSKNIFTLITDPITPSEVLPYFNQVLKIYSPTVHVCIWKEPWLLFNEKSYLALPPSVNKTQILSSSSSSPLI